MSRPSSGYDYTFVRVEDFDSAKKLSIAKGCNKTVKTLYPPEDKLTTPNMCVIGCWRISWDRVGRTDLIGQFPTCLKRLFRTEDKDCQSQAISRTAHSSTCLFGAHRLRRHTRRERCTLREVLRR